MTGKRRRASPPPFLVNWLVGSNLTTEKSLSGAGSPQTGARSRGLLVSAMARIQALLGGQ